MNIADEIFDRCRAHARAWPKGIAEQLELLRESTDDGGSEIEEAVERWLQSDDEERVRVAVEIEGCFPFRHRAEMDAVLTLVKARWPELSEKCDRLITSRSDEESRPPADVQSRVERLRVMLQRV